MSDFLLKLLPKGIQSFEKMIKDNYVYVDKTRYIYDIITKGTYYFLSRPRRFGKSLLLSTLHELFAGNKELFKGLWIDTANYNWQPHPVIHLSFSALASNSAQALHDDLVWKLESLAESHSLDISKAPSLQTKFESIVTQLASSNSVVILIDEYDFPILNNITDLPLAGECRNIIKNFFGVIKDLDNYIKFVMITGVSKFSKTSIFSGLNNLEDLTLSQQAAGLLGYTSDELKTNFGKHIAEIATNQEKSSQEILESMQLWYNGYQFSKNQDIKVYNPYSILLFLSSGELSNYWFETGTPTFLVNLIKAKNFPIPSLDAAETNVDDLKNIEIDNIPVIPLLLQTGYLTLKSYDPITNNYQLSFPNLEVKSSFFRYLLKQFSTFEAGEISKFTAKLKTALNENKIDLFCRLLQTFFADIPSGIQLPQEKYYQTILYVLANLINIKVITEEMTNIGRIDMVASTDSHIYIFEFKTKRSAQQALQQIEDKKYYEKYLLGCKKIVLVGVKFNTEKRNLEEWTIKALD